MNWTESLTEKMCSFHSSAGCGSELLEVSLICWFVPCEQVDRHESLNLNQRVPNNLVTESFERLFLLN